MTNAKEKWHDPLGSLQFSGRNSYSLIISIQFGSLKGAEGLGSGQEQVEGASEGGKEGPL